MRLREIQIALTLGGLLTLVASAAAQDLGSSNKLFGGAAPHVSTAKKTVTKGSAARQRPATARATKRKLDTGAKIAGTYVVDGRSTVFIPAIRSKKTLSAAELRTFRNYLDEGAKARRDRNYRAAEAAFKRATILNPGDAAAFAGLGGIYADQLLWRESSDAYTTATGLDPRDPSTLIALSYVLSQPIYADDLSQRYERAEKAARLAVQLSPKSAAAHDQLGCSLKVRGDVGAETESAFRKAIDLDPAFAPAYAHLGRLLSLRGHEAEAKAAFAKAIARASDVPGRVIVAEVLQSESRFDDAERLLRSALSQDPKNQMALMLLGHALIASGRFPEAEQSLLHTVTIVPNSYGPIILLSSLYLRQGKLEQSEMQLFEAQRIAPAGEKRVLARQFEALGDAYSKLGKKAEAVRCYRTASALDVGSTALASKLARVGGD